MMDQVLAGLPFAFCYINNILVASPDHAAHQQHLQQALERLREAGLVLNIKKCAFAQSSVDFLGHHVGGRSPAPAEPHRRRPGLPAAIDCQGATGFPGDD
jgi:hypothetical protein